MPALVDHWYEVNQLPVRERIVGVARFFMGASYELGSKDARALDGMSGQPIRKIDCSGFVRNVFDSVFPEQGLAARSDLNALKFQTIDLFVDVDTPRMGDIVCWDGHVGIVYDPASKTFIGSQTSTGVMVASYEKGYWATTKVVKKFRSWKDI
jgi:cell wall-associated NlpC family hydrolase